MEYKLNNNIYIEELDDVLSRIEDLVSQEINPTECIEHMRNSENQYYFDNKLNQKEADYNSIAYLWLDTGYVDRNTNPIFISLLNNRDYYSGKFVGNPKFLSNCAQGYYYYNSEEIADNTKKLESKYRKKSAKGLIKHFNCSNEAFIDCKIESISIVNDALLEKNLASEIYDNLVFSTFSSVEGLERYLKICGVRIWDLVQSTQRSFYIQNSNATKLVINTGLMNRIAEDVYVIFDVHLGKKIYLARELVKSKGDLIRNGFTKEDAINVNQLLPISFFDEDESRLLVADYDDFDLSYDKLDHVLHERRERFPSNIQDMSDSEIVNKIILNLQFDLKILKRDPFFAKASYSGNENHKGVSWMLPLYLNSDCGCGKPELVMVIVKCGEFYEVKTVLQYDKCIEDRAVAINLYKYMW